MPFKLETLVKKISSIPNKQSAQLVEELDNYLRDIGRQERYRKNQLSVMIAFCNYLGSKSLLDVKDRKEITAFLDSKMKTKEVDPDERWRVTWNAYLDRIKYFYRWNQTQRGRQADIQPDEWETPEFARIRRKKVLHETYTNEEIWDDPDDVHLIIKYMPILRNKLAISLAWDMNGRPDEVCKIEWRHLHLYEQYGEGQVPANTKTGMRPVLLRMSFPYARDWKNGYPFVYHAKAKVICNLTSGKQITPDAIYSMMMEHKERLLRMIRKGKILDEHDRERLEYLLTTKKWNPYCFRHSSIDYDLAYLPEFAGRKKVGWSMNSKQPGRYMKRRMNQSIKMQILARDGIVLEQDPEGPRKSPTKVCPRCQLVNAMEMQVCTKCAYPLSQEALEEVKQKENAQAQQIAKEVVGLISQNPELIMQLFEQMQAQKAKSTV